MLAAGETPAALQLVRRRQALLSLEHLVLMALLGTGAALMAARGWSLGHPRWLGAKLGLVVFLVVPLQSMYAYVGQVWIRRGLAQTKAPPFSKDLRRGLAMDEMIRTLTIVLLGAAVPLMVWLSVAKPF